MTIDEPRSMRERMRAGDASRGDGEPCDFDGRATILRKLLGDVGDGVHIRQPFRCDYTYQIRIGPRTVVSVGVTALDVAPITIGGDALIGAGAVVPRDLS
jgi:maltose O-acetyltransferase